MLCCILDVLNTELLHIYLRFLFVRKRLFMQLLPIRKTTVHCFAPGAVCTDWDIVLCFHICSNACITYFNSVCIFLGRHRQGLNEVMYINSTFSALWFKVYKSSAPTAHFIVAVALNISRHKTSSSNYKRLFTWQVWILFGGFICS